MLHVHNIIEYDAKYIFCCRLLAQSNLDDLSPSCALLVISLLFFLDTTDRSIAQGALHDHSSSLRKVNLLFDPRLFQLFDQILVLAIVKMKHSENAASHWEHVIGIVCIVMHIG